MATSNMSIDACAFGCLKGMNTNCLKACQCPQSFYLGINTTESISELVHLNV